MTSRGRRQGPAFSGPPREPAGIEHRCPDCGVTMEEVRFGMADAWGPCVHTGEKRAGLLGKLGVNERKDPVTVCGGESVRASGAWFEHSENHESERGSCESHSDPREKGRGESHIPRATNRSV
ncbi:hypothetical protein BRC74_01550 [Halobacteriales archaeon QH_7_68_42]|nr:MAG: hypothetical protein BRC74_01550 [Halobacteriales archaeon QH_7_68_42]